MLQSYYQTQLMKWVYLQPTITYIPTPGASLAYKGPVAATLRLTYLF
jgi:porin